MSWLDKYKEADAALLVAQQTLAEVPELKTVSSFRVRDAMLLQAEILKMRVGLREAISGQNDSLDGRIASTPLGPE